MIYKDGERMRDFLGRFCFYCSLVFYFWEAFLRWPNTVLARAFADAIQHVHKDFNKQTCRQ